MSSDQRASFRFPVPSGHEQAVLRVGRRDVDVRVVNTSATGFLLAVPQLEVKEGDVLRLLTETGWSEVRVAFVGNSGEECRLGVERIRDLASELDQSPFQWL